jgi:hypothetical protein
MNSMKLGRRKLGKKPFHAFRIVCDISDIFAREEFCAHGLSEIITICHRNVCKDGFTVTGEIDAGKRVLLYM